MFTDPMFKIALGVSFFAHLAVIAPMPFFPKGHEDKEIRVDPAIELNYVVIKEPRLAEEEIYSEGASAEKKLPEETVFREVPEVQETSVVTYDEKINAEAAFLKYYNLIREKIRTEIHSTGRKSINGTVTATFTLDANGRLSGISNMVSNSSPRLNQRIV